MNQNTKKLALSGIFIAIAVVFSAFSIPVGVAKVFPVQHLINIVGGVLLGPFYALAIAFGTSLIRILIGTGSLFAFPGSIFGAFLSGYLYKYHRRLLTAFLGEVLGTGIIGAVCSYPIALFIMGNKEAALFGFVIPFISSSLAGAVIGMVLLKTILWKGQIKLDSGTF